MEAKYLGKSAHGLKNKHLYEIEIDKPKDFYVYNITILEDKTDGKAIDLVMNYASQISIDRNWEIKNKK